MTKQFTLDGNKSYLPVLETLYKHTQFKTVLEIVEHYDGCGDWSTKTFRATPDLDLLTVQTNPAYTSINTDKCINLKDIHQFNALLEDTTMFDLVFIDTRVELAYIAAQALFKNTSIIVMHDTQASIYCIDKIVKPANWYYADFVFHRPWTGIFTRYKQKLEAVVNEIPGLLYENMDQKIYIEQV